ncbi:MAG: putative sugar O-methyltransferase [Rhodospirillaceae bacterium]|jgi:putative sugar O-methyltransferase|nr:putative sugar O-methyltransferase [Rhodospirillaceae bacterium]MBT4589196.1 putative sugar O-methyltransferase [Rhodospirillaceae bacterium]MBT4941305.1 putative sugar O-methyltransferase [Rhodospirillaceae bacterium]MBT5941759.1 putative sugar O-methyltransferase [Rhodospirillaceae bacterium]MBT7267669.1 putative sugar O-methyltransferase [Rhodospirillaceae bacterium]
MLLQEARTIFETVYKECQNSGYFDRYLLNEWWRANEKDLVTIIRQADSAAHALSEVQSLIHFSVYTTYSDPQRINDYIQWMIDYLQQKNIDLFSFPEYVQEAEFFKPDNVVDINGRRLSPDFLRFFELWQTIRSETKLSEDNTTRILELGSGYGAQARMAKLLNPKATLYLVDLPFSLFFAYLFIKSNFPEAKTLYLSDATDTAKLKDDWDFVFVPTIFSDALEDLEFDIFINTNSMTEMHNDVITYWFNFLQIAGRVGYIYLDNRFINRCEEDDHRTDENACFGSLDAQWELQYWAYDDPATHSPYLATLHPTNLRLIAKGPTTLKLPEELAAKSGTLFDQVKSEDWFLESLRLKEDGNHAIEISRYLNFWPRTFGPHRFDGSISGTLYKLWDAIRLNPTADKIVAMLAYLKFISTGIPPGFRIEEEYFYENLLKRMSNDD